MSSKTPAELQMEFLKKLKEQQKSGKVPKIPVAKPATGPVSSLPAITLQSLRVSPKRKALKRSSKVGGLKASVKAWRQFAEEFKKRGLNPRDKKQGDWALQLLLGLPLPEQPLSDELKAELFARMREWMDSRGLK